MDKASLLPPERITHHLQGDDTRQMDLRTVGKGEALSHQGLTQGSAGSISAAYDRVERDDFNQGELL